MAEMDPFDRTTWKPAQAAAADAQQHERLVQHGQDAATVLLAFLTTLESHLSHEEALYLAAHVWRLT